jgi:polyisoprenoid-binding protein YceI
MATWKIDPVHSEIKFKVKHLLVSTVTGEFKKFDATVESASTDFHDAKISFEADIDSIDTRNEQRDGHLKSPDFFDAPNFPKLSFVSKSVTKKNDEELHYSAVSPRDSAVRRRLASRSMASSTVKISACSGTESRKREVLS